jgi:hypothetical protein
MINTATSEEFWDDNEIFKGLYYDGIRVLVSDDLVFKMWDELNPPETHLDSVYENLFKDKIREIKPVF